VVSASFNRACSTKQSRRTKRDISAIRAAILDVIEDDPPMTVRQVFYQLVSRGVIDASLVARLRSVIAPADGSPGMADGGSGDADTSNSGPTWAASEANLRDHAVRLRNRCRRYCLRRSCEGYDKASSSNQPDHFYPPFKDRSLSFRRIVLPLC
jgi:citrate lyase gamma subunit